MLQSMNNKLKFYIGGVSTMGYQTLPLNIKSFKMNGPAFLSTLMVNGLPKTLRIAKKAAAGINKQQRFYLSEDKGNLKLLELRK